MIDVLLVEDTASDAELTIRALRKNKLADHVVWLKDGVFALDFLFYRGEFASRPVELPKLVLLDLKMPRVGGLEVLKQLREDGRTQSVPIVVMTSSAQAPDIKKAYALGANSYIVKPVGFDNFSDTVVKLGLYWINVNRLPPDP